MYKRLKIESSMGSLFQAQTYKQKQGYFTKNIYPHTNFEQFFKLFYSNL